MSDSIYRSYGLHKGIANEQVNKLTKSFRADASRRERQGVFLGVEFLQNLVNDLVNGNYDGVIVKFGISQPRGNAVPTYELVATQLELKGGQSYEVARRGVNYSSKGGNSIHPPDVGTPPIDTPAD